MAKIRKEDRVIVIAGKYKGATGVVSAVKSDDKVLVEGVNIVKKAVKPNPNAQQAGGIIDKVMPIHISNIALLSKDGKRCKVSWEIEDGKKTRVLKEIA